jgi:hypothetical protein
MDIYHSKKLKDFLLAMQLVGDVYSTPHKKKEKDNLNLNLVTLKNRKVKSESRAKSHQSQSNKLNHQLPTDFGYNWVL